MHKMPKVLVIGYGNPLRGDDGIGWVVAEKLRGILLPEQATIKTQIQLTPELAVDLSEADLVIFIDVQVGEPIGAVTCRRVEPLTISPLSFSHHFTPDSLLTYAQNFFGKAPKAYLVSVNGTEFGYCEGLSPPVKEAVPKAVELVLGLLEGKVKDEKP